METKETIQSKPLSYYNKEEAEKRETKKIEKMFRPDDRSLNYIPWKEGYTTKLPEGKHLFCITCGVICDDDHDGDHIVNDVGVSMKFGCVPIADYGIAVNDDDSFSELTEEEVQEALTPDY